MDGIAQFKEDLRAGRIDVGRLIQVVVTLQRQREAAARERESTQRELEAAQQRIAELEQQLRGRQPPPTAAATVDEPFSLRAEEKRQQARPPRNQRQRSRKRRRGRLTTADKVKLAKRTVPFFPAGVPAQDCHLSHTRPVWRLEQGRALLIAYQIYRGPKNQYGKITGVLGRNEFGLTNSRKLDWANS